MGSRSCPERSAWKAIEVVDQLDQLDQLGPARENQLVQAIREWLRVVVCAGPAGPALFLQIVPRFEIVFLKNDPQTETELSAF